MQPVLEKLRELELGSRVGPLNKPSDRDTVLEFARSGVKFAVLAGSSEPVLEDAYYRAVRLLQDCLVPNRRGQPILQEGGVYHGCWLESTGTINAEVLSRFIPSAAQATFEQFAEYQREDGLLPYKITKDGPAFKQIQLVTPLARSVWNHDSLNGRDERFLKRMYESLSRYDQWLATYRNTRGTGCVEAFCTFDTGHDLSARFWHAPDTPHRNDPKRCDPDSPILPFLAPDLTANVYCSRKYYGRMAERLAAPANPWPAKAEETLNSLMTHCFDPEDRFFYDIDRHGQIVRVQSDVLLRVLACEVGDGALFEEALRRYLLNTRKFFAKYPLTSLAMDDPRFDPHSTYNTWSGAVNFLTLIRTPHAFEHHRRFVELTWIMQPIVSAVSRFTRFGQCLSPWTGKEGYTEAYSPAILCALDYIERLCGIVPTADGELWFTGLLPSPLDHGVTLAEQTAYSRTVDGRVFELVNTEEGSYMYADGRRICRFPYGLRVVTDRRGELKAVIGMSVRKVEGKLEYGGSDYSLSVEGNETLAFENGAFVSVARPGVVFPTYG